MTSTTIEEIGSTRLEQDGSNYILHPNGGSSIELSYGGAPVVAGQFDQFGGPWAPIGAEQTASGYVVAWKVTGADQYTVWFTDNNGNYISSAFDFASGSSTVLKSFETSFQQDLNGDGLIGLKTTVIEEIGSTRLEQVGSNYFLDPNGGSAVELSFGGAPVVAGQFDQIAVQWALIGAEQTAGGYVVAWKVTGADQFEVWNTDNSGNFVSTIGIVSGTSAVLESFETSFQQDLNGDGLVGPPPPPPTTMIEAFGSTSLAEGGGNYFLDPNGGSAVELSYAGAPVVAGQFDQFGGHWVPIAAEQTSSGYEVAWKITGADQYTVWFTDNSGNYISSAFDSASGSSTVLESFETSFQQDLNGDGLIGLKTTVIEEIGSTRLEQVGSNYFLDPNGGSAVELSFGGAPVVAGQFDQIAVQWALIGAEQTAGGYVVAWKVTGADQFEVWNTDNSGNFVSTIGIVSGTSAVLESFETSFQQDLNGDGLVGPPPPPPTTMIEAFGSTSLAEGGGNYFLDPNGGSAVELSYGGAPVVAGQFDQFGGPWAPIGAEQTASGYVVAWKVTGADQYTVWFTDNNGNYISSAFDFASGTSTVLESFETSFQQDLNGDGLIGLKTTVIESFGSTSLAEGGGNYFLDPNGGSAVELSFGGAPVVAGQFDQFGGHWVPIAAEQTSSGYEVAWKIAGADQYTVWFTDNSGNYISSAFDSASGSSTALQSFETSFQQDLNGDGVIVVESFGSTSLAEGGGNYFLDPNGGSAVELSFGGAPVVDGQFDQFGGHWVPIAAEQTSSGYEVAWKIAGADQYTVWFTDNSGNYISSAFDSASGSSTAVQSFETSFQQDLNGDGVIVIESFGSTSLAEGGGNYILHPNGGSSIELSYGGAPVVDGQFDQFGPWVPIGAEQTASGYEVAWKVTGADQFQVWNTDNSGNFVSSTGVVSGTSAALESFETSFHQDLNGDGSIGLPNEGSSPQFVYQGVDGNGVQLYDVVWNTPGFQPFAVRVLAPDHPSADYEHSFLYALPVQAGLAQSTYGSGLNQLQQIDAQDQYNATIIEPIFPIDPWYANNPTDATINFEAFMATVLPAWVDSNFATSGTEENLLIGLSKSGYGGLDLAFKHPSVFDAVAAFDFPADMAAYDAFGSSSSGNYGTDTNFQDNYRMTNTFIETWKAPFTTQDRILISEGEVFQTQVADFDALLTSDGIEHTLLTQTNDAHSWFGDWLSDDVAGLYSLVETNWVTGASGDWSTASDWLSGAAPTAIVDAVINNSNSVTLDGAAAAHALTLDNSDLAVSGTFTLGASLTLDGVSELDLSGGVLSARSIEVGASGHFLGDGTISGPVEVTGTIEVSQSALELTGAVSGTGLFTIDNGATLQFDGSVTSGTTAAFLGASGTLIIEQPSSFDSHISGISGSGDVLDLKGFDAANTTATPTFNSGTHTTTLTVTDSAHALSVSLTLDGDYSNSTFTATSDGHGGTDVVDPPTMGSAGSSAVSSDGSEGANGTITFANFNFTSTETANFILEGSDYVGVFSLDPVSSSDGSASVGWEFHLGNDQIQLSPGETVTQSYDVTVNDEQSSTVHQTASVSVGGPGNDNFVFQPGIGADTIVNFNPQIDTIELDHFANVQSTQQLATLVTTDTHGNAVIDLGHSDSITLPNVNSAQLQAALQNAVHLL